MDDRIQLQTVLGLACWGAKAALLRVFSELRPHRFGEFSTISSLAIVSALDKQEKFRA